jgi:hypothetical protein
VRAPERQPTEPRTRQSKGIPDGLLLGGLGFLLGLTALCWTATGLAGLLSHGAWPDGVSFTRTPTAVRALLTHPHDIAAAWPATPAGQLSGYGLFWGLFLSQVMVLVVLTVFVLGTFTRWRAVRRTRRAARPMATKPMATKPMATPAAAQAPAPGPAPVAEVAEVPEAAEVAEKAAPLPAAAVPASQRLLTGGPVFVGLKDHADAVQAALRDAEGAALVVTADPELYTSTAGARAKLGPVHVYDPLQLTDAPARLRWAPHQHCEGMAVARDRATALLAPLRSPGRTHDPVHETARTLLRCWLHAAAVAGEPFREVHRWALSGGAKDAVRILRTDTRAVAGSAGELEATLTAHPERRAEAEELARRALTCTSRVHVRNACTPSRNDAAAWASFVHERGTLYAVGEPIEAPHRGDPGAMPLLTAFTSAVVGHGRLMAERSSAGRLDPPLTVLLDQPATVAPLPELPALLADGAAAGLHTVAFLRSEAQKQTWWGDEAARL